jgi:predicted phage tail protein
MILKTVHDRLAFRFGRQTGLRSTSDTVDQLQAQIESLKEQIKFNAAEYERHIAALMRDLMAAHYELARRDLVDAFADASSPSTMVH